jgi:hypothetical protein
MLKLCIGLVLVQGMASRRRGRHAVAHLWLIQSGFHLGAVVMLLVGLFEVMFRIVVI